MHAAIRHDAISIDDIHLHCLDYPGTAPPIVLLHSLSGNTRLFDGLIDAGLSPGHRLIVPDLRGRGRTDAPMEGYSLADGARDFLGLLDHFGLAQVVLCGHSFGGLLAMYVAAHHPERVSALIMLDAGVEMHPATPVMSAAAAARLDMVFPSAEVYQAMVRTAPFVTPWYDTMSGFFEEDMKPVGLGAVTTRSRAFVAALASLHIFGVSSVEWRQYAAQVQAPTLLVQATLPFLMGMPMLLDRHAEETVDIIGHARRAHAEGNHFSMLFGPGAKAIVTEIRAFLAAPPDVSVAPAKAEGHTAA
jgi:pimeloyl-ACP methyl ester carboxylesterase